MIVMILSVIIIKAKIPNGCERNDKLSSPLNKYEIEFPNPHPGQKSNPRLAKGQIVKCVSPGM
jgi:hypothetical protein